MSKAPDVRAMMGDLARKLGPPPSKAKRKAKRRAKTPKAALPVRAEARKPRPARPALPQSNVVKLVASKPEMKISPTAMSRARTRRQKTLAPQVQVNRSTPSPFALPAFPKGVGPGSGVNGGMAMDEFPAFSWAQTQIGYNGAYWDGQAFFGFTLLAELAQRPEYRRMAETIATEATRKWIKLQVTTAGPPTKDGKKPKAADATDKDKSAKLKKLEDAMKRLCVKDCFREIAEQDGLFGRAHLYLDTGVESTDEGELKTPIGDGREDISAKKVNKEKPLKALRTVEAMWCSPTAYNSSDPLDARWYKPDGWYVMAREVNSSRLLTFVSREVPDMLKPAYAFGGLPLTQMAKPYVDNWLRTRQSVSDLIASFSTQVLETDLMASLAGDGNLLYDRLDLYNLLRDNHGIFVLNKDTEEFKNVTTPLSTLDKLQAQSQEQMSSVAGIPIVIFLGIQPMGLNASSEGEIRVFYDRIAAYQETVFSPNLTRVIDFIQLSEFGSIDPEITFAWEPLWALDAKGKAEVKKIEADTDAVYIGEGVLDAGEVRTRVAADADSPYASIDPDDVPEPPDDGDDGTGTPGPGGGPGGPKKKPAPAQDEDPSWARRGAGSDGTIPFAGGLPAAFDAFNASQARDPIGRWTKDGGDVVAYHGTTQAAVAKILKNGFEIGRPRTFTSRRLIEDFDGSTFKSSMYEGERGRAIFVTSDPSVALQYANDRIDLTKAKSKPAVFEVHIPKAAWAKFHADQEHSYGGKAAYTTRKIPPEWIKRYASIGKSGKFAMTTLAHDAASDDDVVLLYVVLDLDSYDDEEIGEDAAFNEADHPRNAIGEFTDGGGAAKALKKAVPELAHFQYRAPHGAYVTKGGRKRDASPHHWIMASTHKNSLGNPITIPGDDKGTGIAIKINEQTKHIHFSELNSHIKGAGRRMVEAILAKYPDYKFSVTDWSHEEGQEQSFWQKIEAKHPDKFAHDEFVERQHPRDRRGRWTDASGSAAAEQFNSKKEHAAHLLQRGVTTKEMLAALGWPSISMPAMAKSLAMNLKKTKQGSVTTYIGTPMTAAERAEAGVRAPGAKPRARKNLSLLEHIASVGGIKASDPLIGDIRSLLGKNNKFIPGFGMLIRPSGLPLDRLREGALEAKYLDREDDATVATTTIRTLLEAIDGELRGQRLYPEGTEPVDTGDRSDHYYAIQSAIDRALTDYEIDPKTVPEKTMKRVVEILDREGETDPLLAYERAVMEETQDDAPEHRIDDVIPGWDIPDDAGAAPQAGHRTS